MKIIRIQPIALGLATLLLFAHSVAAKTKKSFLPFKGTYSGVATILLPGGTNTATSTVSVAVSVPKNGRSATMTVAGVINIDGNTVPLTSTLNFAGGTFTMANEFFAESGIVPAPGTYALASPRAFSFSNSTTAGDTTVTIDGTVTVKPKGRKQTMNLSAILATSFGVSYPVQLALTGKAPKVK